MTCSGVDGRRVWAHGRKPCGCTVECWASALPRAAHASARPPHLLAVLAPLPALPHALVQGAVAVAKHQARWRRRERLLRRLLRWLLLRLLLLWLLLLALRSGHRGVFCATAGAGWVSERLAQTSARRPLARTAVTGCRPAGSLSALGLNSTDSQLLRSVCHLLQAALGRQAREMGGPGSCDGAESLQEAERR